MSEGRSRRVAVLGAGITGLSAAYELVLRARRERRQVEVLVLEASSRIGGKVQTENYDGIPLELGPDSFVTAKPHALDLIRELGLGGELLKTNPSSRTVYVYSGGRLEPLPEGSLVPPRLKAFLTSRLLSWEGKFRLALEPLIPCEEGGQDESLGSFVRRRLGPEALEKIVGPILAGIYAGDYDRMSLESTFPQLKAMEKKGGLLRGVSGASAAAQGPGSDITLFMTLKGGLSRLIDALALRLPPQTVRTMAPAEKLFRRGELWQIQTPGGLVSADAVISALPAPALAQALSDFDFELSCLLREIPFVSTATASLVYERGALPRALEGFGFLVPRSTGLSITAATYSSTKFPGRAPVGTAVIRCFMGGAGREGHAEAEEAAIARAARGELRQILGLGEAHPKTTRVARWLKANPQYNVGHGLRLKRLESCLLAHPGLALAGCSYQGVGLPDCIRSGREAAARVFAGLSTKRPAGVA